MVGNFIENNVAKYMGVLVGLDPEEIGRGLLY